MAKLQKIKEKVDKGLIESEKELAIYEEIEDVRESVEEKLKNLQQVLEADKIFKDLFYSSRGIKASESLMSDVADFLKKDTNFVTLIKGEKGEDGKSIKGQDGFTPVKGKDYFTQKEIEYIIAEATKNAKPIKGVDYFDGLDGEDGKDADPQAVADLVKKQIVIPVLDTGEQIVEKINKSKSIIDMERVEGLKDIEKKADLALQRPIMMGGGGSNIRDIRAGTNVSVSKVNGIYTISSSSGTANFIDNEVVSGSGTAFTLANTPVAGSVHVYLNGMRAKLTEDYTISGTGITTTLSWSAGDMICDYRV